MQATLPEIYHQSMKGCTVKTPRCAICGRPAPLNQHHIVKRSSGKLFQNGREVPKPTITLCGFGNNLKDADGHEYCHGLAHANRLHFKWVVSKQKYGTYANCKAEIGGHWEFLLTDEPTRYQDALDMAGWKPLPKFHG